ncbi:MAG: hypothetical protein QOI82_1568 [Actinomycetota bacterium]|jgi:hypothetical protein|nr:hypothetical protein [Actinomycetota bacterium]
MAGWFDELAKKSAKSSVLPSVAQHELSRRSLLAKGALVAGAAWTAPMLLGAQPAFAGLSTCQTFICTQTGGSICCPNSTDTCNADTNNNPVCTVIHDLGGSCGNQGQGVCNHPYKCNGNNKQCNHCTRPNICGGEGSQCCNQTECFGALICHAQGTAGFCRKVCTTATVNLDCTATQVCSGGFCAESCTTNSDCNGTATCVSGVCNYQVDGGVTC